MFFYIFFIIQVYSYRDIPTITKKLNVNKHMILIALFSLHII